MPRVVETGPRPQVSPLDRPSPGPAAAAASAPVGAASACEPPPDLRRRGDTFGDLLASLQPSGRKRSPAPRAVLALSDVDHPLAPASPPPPWARAEGAPRAAPASGSGHADQAAAAPVAGHRLLLGVGAHRTEARLHIEHGPHAGAEIHLRCGAAGSIQAVVLTPLESSRKTLLVVMHEVARRLARKGYHLAASGSSLRDRGGSHPPPGER